MRCLNSWHAPAWFRLWMIAATRGGDGWLWGALAAVVLMFGGAERWIAVEACTTAAVFGVLIFLLLKRKTCRRRPCEFIEHCWATLLPPDQFSFPSGHTITAFAITVPLGLLYPPVMPVLLFCAFSIGTSRVMLGMHFLSDVVAGIVIGSGLGYLAYTLYL